MTATVLMVRHGSHDRLGKILCGRMPDVWLNEAGAQEAQSLAHVLAERPLGAVYSSPLERARQTAEPIARAHHVSVQIDADINEIDFGDWTGRPFETLDPDTAWSAWNSRRDIARPPGGETVLEVQTRVARFLRRVCERHAGQQVAMVSHADVIKAALAHVLGLSLGHHDRLEISPASVSRVVAGDWGAKVHSINEAAPWP